MKKFLTICAMTAGLAFLGMSDTASAGDCYHGGYGYGGYGGYGGYSRPSYGHRGYGSYYRGGYGGYGYGRGYSRYGFGRGYGYGGYGRSGFSVYTPSISFGYYR